MMVSKDLGLTMLTNYQVKALPNGQVSLAKKFLDRKLLLTELWPGSIRLLIEDDPNKDEFLEGVIVRPDELPFKLEVIPYNALTPTILLEKTSIVLTATGYKHNDISKVCRQATVPCVYYLDYDLKTRKQIIAIETKNPLLRFRRTLWAENQERKQLKAMAIASGVQCNGVPTYKVCQKVNPNTLLYFTNNVTEDLLATPEEIETRTRDLCHSDRPLQLLFSGRLVGMKGADHLIDVAEELKQLGVKFQMFICGDGELKDTMQRRILESGLSNDVKMMGVRSFKTELIPFVKNIDLFVCCHRQGDPSSTYQETMSCGVPIVGYANDAFLGVVEQSQAGWLVEMNQPKLLAKKIAELDKVRSEIKAMSFKALDFAKLHTFQKTYERRAAHLERTARERD